MYSRKIYSQIWLVCPGASGDFNKRTNQADPQYLVLISPLDRLLSWANACCIAAISSSQTDDALLLR